MEGGICCAANMPVGVAESRDNEANTNFGSLAAVVSFLTGFFTKLGVILAFLKRLDIFCFLLTWWCSRPWRTDTVGLSTGFNFCRCVTKCAILLLSDDVSYLVEDELVCDFEVMRLSNGGGRCCAVVPSYRAAEGLFWKLSKQWKHRWFSFTHGFH